MFTKELILDTQNTQKYIKTRYLFQIHYSLYTLVVTITTYSPPTTPKIKKKQ